jgi:integrase
VPSVEEVDAILSFIRDYYPQRNNGREGVPPEMLYAAVGAMAWRGFRVGGLSELTIAKDKFTTVSKGKNWSGDLLRSAEVLRPLGSKPFAAYSTRQLLVEVRIRTAMMVKDGLLSYGYSAHTFRHHFASVEYAMDHDVLRVCKLLNHADVGITTRYLHEKLGIELK